MRAWSVVDVICVAHSYEWLSYFARRDAIALSTSGSAAIFPICRENSSGTSGIRGGFQFVQSPTISISPGARLAAGFLEIAKALSVVPIDGILEVEIFTAFGVIPDCEFTFLFIDIPSSRTAEQVQL